MKLDGAIMTIERRSPGACMDMAFVFYRLHAQSLLILTAWFAIPSCVLVWFMTQYSDYGFLLNVVWFSVCSPYLGAGLAAAAGYRVFGDEFTVGLCFRLVSTRFARLSATILLSRFACLLLACLIIPVPLIATHYGFTPEVLLLEQDRRGSQRLGSLMGYDFGATLGRMLFIVLFCGCLAVALFMLMDFAGGLLFGTPVLIGRTSWDYASQEFFTLLAHDPLLNATIHGVLWLIYPLGRLAWFFCYIDIRTRRECWDAWLDFRIEANRLEGRV